jgi:putative phage-type endonuclease
MYFECNLPKQAPDHLHPSMVSKVNNVLSTVHNRMLKLNTALDITGFDGATFSRFAKFLFDNMFESFERMTAEELAAFVFSINDGRKAEPRMEWPNAMVVVDTAFLQVDEWEVIRCFSIGGSDSAAVIGTSPHRTAQELYHDKVGTPVKILESNNYTFARGHFLEQNVIDAFCKITGCRKIPETRMFVSKKYPHCSANIDQLIQFPDGRIFVYEAKTTINENREAWTNNKVPRHYMSQMRQYPAVLDDDRVYGTYIGCLFTEDYTLGGQYLGSTFSEDRFLSRCLDRDIEEERELLEAEEAFWAEYIDAGIEPPPSGIPKKDIEILRRYSGYADPNADVVELDLAEFEEAIADYLRLGEERSILEKRAEGLKARQDQIAAQFIERLGTAILGCVDIDGINYYEVRYSPRSKTVTDMEKLKIAYPDAYANCVTVLSESSRVFSIKKKVKRETQKKKKAI